MNDTPEISLPKDKKVLVIGGGIAIVAIYWWWNRAPAVPAPDTGVPASDDSTRVPAGAASGDASTSAPPADVPMDDTAWAQKAITTMSALGFDSGRVSAVTSKWLSGEGIDSVKEAALVSLILSRVGLPPSGLHPVLNTTVPAPTDPPVKPPPAATWRGPMVRVARGLPVINVKVQTKSEWLWWVRHEYTNLPPDVARQTAAAKQLMVFNISLRGKKYNRAILDPAVTPVISVPAALYV